MIRDQALLVSGLLSAKMGGPQSRLISPRPLGAALSLPRPQALRALQRQGPLAPQRLQLLETHCAAALAHHLRRTHTRSLRGACRQMSSTPSGRWHAQRRDVPSKRHASSPDGSSRKAARCLRNGSPGRCVWPLHGQLPRQEVQVRSQSLEPASAFISRRYRGSAERSCWPPASPLATSPSTPPNSRLTPPPPALIWTPGRGDAAPMSRFTRAPTPTYPPPIVRPRRHWHRDRRSELFVGATRGSRQRPSRIPQLPAQSETGDLSAPVRSAFADNGPLFAEAHSAPRFGEELPDSIRQGQRLTGMTSGQKRFPVAPSVYKFARYGKAGIWLSELLPHTAKDSRRDVRGEEHLHRSHRL